MRYRFVGGQDVPEWILAEVSVLSKISCVRLKLICRQVIYDLCGVPLDFEKLAKLVPKDGGFTASDIKATVAAIAFVVTNATRYRVDAEALNAELQQLGLPKENSDGISRPFRIHRDKLTAQAAADSLRLPRVCSAAVRSDVIVASSACGGLLPAASASSAPSQPTCVYHVSLGLSHGMSGNAPRVAAPDAESTQLLQSAAARSAAATARPVPGLGLEPGLAQQAQAALLALNAQPLVPSAAPVGSPSPSEAASGSASSAAARVLPSQRIAFTVSAEKAAALLAELRVARRVLASLAAASAATAAGSAGASAGAGGAAAAVGEA